MKKSISLSPSEIKENINKLRQFMNKHQLDGFYVSSFDPYLNEYVPLEDCHRYYLTGFTGSTAEVLLPKNGKIRLYVDGRYHEQADKEVDLNEVEVVKCTPAMGNTEAMLNDIRTAQLKKVGHEADRTSLGFLKRLEEATETMGFFQNELHQIINFAAIAAPKELQHIPREWRGRDTLEKAQLACQSNEQAMYVTALDAIAWLTNCRGYHLPHLSSFRAKMLLTRNQAYVFVSPETPINEKAQKIEGISWIKVPTTQIPQELSHLQNKLHLAQVEFDPAALNCADFGMLLAVFGPDRLKEKRGGLVEWMSIKEPIEIRQMEESFKRGDKAIYQTIKGVKQSLKEGKRVTELDLWHATSKNYQAQGCKEQSFNTIAGVGPNGSIIHYGDPSDQVVMTANDMVLLDSGGYFDGGFATDTTRTFLAADEGKPDPKCVEIYTLTLKAMLAVQTAVFLEGTKGNVLDGLARAPLMKRGFNYNHGTGHGVGIHVHEDGVRLSMISQLPMKVGQVVSIEPGIYIPGFGGVRLENIAVVEKHPEFKGYLCFRSLVFVGFDHHLIDKKMLSPEELSQLDAYEAECAKRGTSFVMKA